MEELKFSYFVDGYGLVTERDKTSENCNLFYACWLILKSENGPLTNEDREWFRINMTSKKNAEGLYNRRSIEELPVRSVSHDEITGWMIASNLLVTPNKDKIWEHLITHFGSYNNNGKEPLPFNPGNYYAWGQLVDNKLSYLFLPMYLINMFIAISKKPSDSSSKIIYWAELSVMKNSWINKILLKIYEKQMVKQYGEKYIQELMIIYHGAESRTEFPIFVELAKIYK